MSFAYFSFLVDMPLFLNIIIIFIKHSKSYKTIDHLSLKIELNWPIVFDSSLFEFLSNIECKEPYINLI